MGTKLSSGQSERTIQVLEDMLRACVLDLGGKWKDHLLSVEFGYNNNFQAIVGIAPYEALYGQWCHSSLYWDKVVKMRVLSPELVEQTV